MPRPLSDLTKIAARLPDELQAAQVRAVNKSALAVTRELRGNIRAATGGDGRLSGVGRRGARVGARYDVKGRVNPTARIVATGPLHLVERDTDPHAIQPRGRRVGKRGRALKGAKALHFDGRFAASATHPGTRGKHPWSRGLARMDDQSKRIFEAEIHKAMVKAVKG